MGADGIQESSCQLGNLGKARGQQQVLPEPALGEWCHMLATQLCCEQRGQGCPTQGRLALLALASSFVEPWVSSAWGLCLVSGCDDSCIPDKPRLDVVVAEGGPTVGAVSVF